MRKALVATLLVCIWTLPASAGSDDARKKFFVGASMVEAGELASAIPYLEETLELDGSFCRANYYLVKCYLDVGDDDSIRKAHDSLAAYEACASEGEEADVAELAGLVPALPAGGSSGGGSSGGGSSGDERGSYDDEEGFSDRHGDGDDGGERIRGEAIERDTGDDDDGDSGERIRGESISRGDDDDDDWGRNDDDDDDDDGRSGRDDDDLDRDDDDDDLDRDDDDDDLDRDDDDDDGWNSHDGGVDVEDIEDDDDDFDRDDDDDDWDRDDGDDDWDRGDDDDDDDDRYDAHSDTDSGSSGSSGSSRSGSERVNSNLDRTKNTTVSVKRRKTAGAVMMGVGAGAAAAGFILSGTMYYRYYYEEDSATYYWARNNTVIGLVTGATGAAVGATGFLMLVIPSKSGSAEAPRINPGPVTTISFQF